MRNPLAAVGIGVGAYNLGVSRGLEHGGHAVEAVRVVGPGFHHGYGYGYFPFGLILFPLFLLGIFLLLRGAFWRGRWGGPGYGPGGWGGPGARSWGGPGPWGQGGPAAGERAEEWHRRQHGDQAGERQREQAGEQPDGGGEPAGT